MLIRLPSDECARAGAILGRAFHDDPVWTALFSDPDKRPETLAQMFTAVTRATLASDGVAEATPDGDGVALWMPPGKSIGFRAMVRSGFALPRFVMKLLVAESRV